MELTYKYLQRRKNIIWVIMGYFSEIIANIETLFYSELYTIIVGPNTEYSSASSRKCNRGIFARTFANVGMLGQKAVFCPASKAASIGELVYSCSVYTCGRGVRTDLKQISIEFEISFESSLISEVKRKPMPKFVLNDDSHRVSRTFEREFSDGSDSICVSIYATYIH
ncbi:unnamed protein product [Nesidiocoris tenuis]|uniref:Uncharacterized protein n=1 Tax=Nesidiocoris tenuis TaxID=355587 RepID=A0A6H5H1D7_9HEMI|nr:unnamed protein product [Nesidiocoris tenuis]